MSTINLKSDQLVGLIAMIAFDVCTLFEANPEQNFSDIAAKVIPKAVSAIDDGGDYDFERVDITTEVYKLG